MRYKILIGVLLIATLSAYAGFTVMQLQQHPLISLTSPSSTTRAGRDIPSMWVHRQL